MSKRKAATKNDSTKPTDAVAQREPLSIERSKSLAERARDEMDLWVSTLSYKDRGKLKMPRSPWGRCGGNIVAVGLRQGKTARRDKKLKRHLSRLPTKCGVPFRLQLRLQTSDASHATERRENSEEQGN